MKRVGILLILLVIASFFIIKGAISKPSIPVVPIWRFTSIDTMKYSRDLSREKLTDPLFDRTIDMQMEAIAKTGATHVSIDTPYDAEFLPMLKRWVASARSHNLHIWFRGNWSGWEKWFGYPQITRVEHLTKTKTFILTNPDLFQDGDVFTACPECENGGPGDPRVHGDVEGHRQFLIQEYAVTKNAFSAIHKNVRSNFNSMNADVARLVMDRKTTSALDGVVTIDHYVSNPKKMAQDIQDISQKSGGHVVIGEFGAPIPDIHGNMTEDEQAGWISSVFQNLAPLPELIGVNYWTNVGGTTQLWDGNGNQRKAVNSLTQAFTSHLVVGIVKDDSGMSLANVRISSSGSLLYSDEHGGYTLPYNEESLMYTFSKSGYQSATVQMSHTSNPVVILKKIHPSLFYYLKAKLRASI